ncbi:MAG: winged helix-turn-helix transcriptional regulator [Alphaproteobacteria bacterium]|nr:winged helix-turn-helix transcriptional regulator [Alphaproteobacteria bacterium]
MVKYQDASLDRVFAALGDTTRRAILARLAEGDATVSDLARPFAISMPAVTKHLDVLERAGLLTRTREGRTRRCTLAPAGLGAARGWIEDTERFWQDQLASFADYLAANPKPPRKERTHGKRPRQRSD